MLLRERTIFKRKKLENEKFVRIVALKGKKNINIGRFPKYSSNDPMVRKDQT